MHILILLLVGACMFVLRELASIYNHSELPWKFVLETKHDTQETYDWNTIIPSSEVDFHSCYGAFECARLELPLDWKNQSAILRRVAVALIKLPAKVDNSDSRYGGSVFVNPGGPAGSGINLVRLHGSKLQTVLDSPLSPNDARSLISNTEKYFDIISFDPRGVGFTTPSFICFPDAVQRSYWQVASESEGLLGSSNVAFELMWARKEALADACYSRMAKDENNETGLGEYMNTPVIAMDMAAIVESLSGSRRRVHNSSHSIRYQRGSESQSAIQEAGNESTDKLQYWGFSYGTLLGETFAAMHPHLVGRMALDGTWEGNLKHADAIIEQFCSYCYEVGPARCALFSAHGPNHIHQRFDEILASTVDKPIPVSISQTRGPEIITPSDVKGAIREALYSPFSKFEQLARIMHEISQRNGTLLAAAKSAQQQPAAPISPECRLKGPYSQECFSPPVDYAEEVIGAIACTDGPDQTNMTAGEFREYWRGLRRESIYLGDRWARNRLLCIFWKLRPRFTYSGFIGGSTSEPILFVGNTLDPVTSLENAEKMSRRFKGSRFLQQDSEGHLSLSTPSLCTAKAIRRYFQTGELPEKGKICPVYDRAFGLPGHGSVPLEMGDDVLLQTLRALAIEMW